MGAVQTRPNHDTSQRRRMASRLSSKNAPARRSALGRTALERRPRPTKVLSDEMATSRRAPSSRLADARDVRLTTGLGNGIVRMLQQSASARSCQHDGVDHDEQVQKRSIRHEFKQTYDLSSDIDGRGTRTARWPSPDLRERWLRAASRPMAGRLRPSHAGPTWANTCC